MDEGVNLMNCIDQVITWSRKKEDLKKSDFISVLMQAIKHASKQYRSLKAKYVECIITNDRELKYIYISHPYKETLNNHLNSVFINYNNTNLAFEGLPKEPEFNLTNIKNFKF